MYYLFISTFQERIPWCSPLGLRALFEPLVLVSDISQSGKEVREKNCMKMERIRSLAPYYVLIKKYEYEAVTKYQFHNRVSK